VNTASQFDHYMARAQEAQDQADKTKDPRIEETWRRIASNYRDLGEAFARQLVRDSDIASEWVVNLGKRSARERLAHLFCEMAVKTKKDRETGTEFAFPVTQTVLGDATGLSTVHVNRSLQSLRRQGVLNFEHGTAQVPDWKAFAEVAGFDRAYLEAETPMRRLSPAALPN
jgi:aspartate/tyrosine/aromatic aminotransferase